MRGSLAGFAPGPLGRLRPVDPNGVGNYYYYYHHYYYYYDYYYYLLLTTYYLLLTTYYLLLTTYYLLLPLLLLLFGQRPVCPGWFRANSPRQDIAWLL